ncbi:ATP-dependent DNA helicase [Coraliomargarita parva]|uniref:ATP-dependent DNA helicase n=1 Tax=Coraliomargarita parva TaxID=3014050 RepID=UPI0022B5CCF8|nr:helicase C-terminal domain-containing protein [Coraliomargarita parva]
MQIDPLERRVRLNVRELAGFRNAPKTERSGGHAWRAAIGQQWHKELESATQARHPEARFEIPVQAVWQHKEWRFDIQGRIDQIVPTQAGGLVLREVKTIRHPLPDAEEILWDRYPDYIAQVAIYLGLARVLPDYREYELKAELLFVDIDSGLTQTLRLQPEHESTFEQQLDALLPFLNDRRHARVRLEDFELKPAFDQLREGQAELFETLDIAATQSRTVLLEAPTGFGKTGIVLEHALRQMKSGMYERCIYLSSKSTGQLQTIEQLRRMIGDGIRYIQMRNRTEHRIESPAHTCTGDSRCDEGLGQLWFEADLHTPELFKDGHFSLDEAKRLGAETGICPYALTKACLPYAEIWIGDSNYVFAPASRAVFSEPYGFDPARTLLIVDEAHNLPDRVADALSVALNAGELLFALEEIESAGAPRQLLRTGRELCQVIDAQPIQQALSPNSQYLLLDLCEDFERQLREARFDFDAAAPFALDIIWRIPDLAKALAGPSWQWLHWLPSAGMMKATCLDASQWTAECLQAFSGSILMSATLAPYDSFRTSCGLKKASADSPAGSAVLAIGHAPWRDDAYDVAIDCRVDTRLKAREQYYETTARTVAALAHYSPGEPVAVFFASYQYAENVKAYLSATDPGLRAMVQPRGVDLNEQREFIEEGLFMADAIFLILGSSYAEGVDQLGGRVHTAMVVGPALPEVNCVQDARMDASPSQAREEAFRDVYIIPAMRRIHQALGRLVRAPGQHARILLHGKRYAEPAYHEQLAPEYQSDAYIRSADELAHWLQS